VERYCDWAMFVQVNAEEMNISSKNVAKIRKNQMDPANQAFIRCEAIWVLTRSIC